MAKPTVPNGVTAPSDPSTQVFTLEDLRYMEPIYFKRTTLEQIVTNLNWEYFRKLSKVSNGWKQACESRLIYHARVRSGSAQTVGVECYPGKIRLSDEEGCGYELPSIPHVEGGLPREYQSLVVGGKLYVLGGMKSVTLRTRTVWTASNEVYVLDLAGHGEWQTCSPMKVPRCNFGCCVKYGTIFVYGGDDGLKAASTEEFYNPHSNAWTLFEKTTKSIWHGSTGKNRVQI